MGRPARGKLQQALQYDEIREILHRLLLAEETLFRVESRWLPAIPEWEIKHALAEHLYEDAQHIMVLRQFLKKLPEHDLPLEEEPYRLALQEFYFAANTPELLTGTHLVLKNLLIKAYELLLSIGDPFIESRLYKIRDLILPAKREHVMWAKIFVATHYDEAGQKNIKKRARQLQRIIEAAGGIISATSETADNVMPALPQRAISPSPFFPDRDPDLQPFWHYEDWNPAWMRKDVRMESVVVAFYYLQEMTVVEILASIIADTPEMSWGFHADIAKYLRNESRHSRLGEQRLQELGCRRQDFASMVGTYETARTMAPWQRLVVLTTDFETRSNAYKQQWREDFYTGGDFRSHNLVRKSLTDDTVHINIGKKWLPILLEVYKVDLTVDQAITTTCFDFWRRLAEFRRPYVRAEDSPLLQPETMKTHIDRNRHLWNLAPQWRI